MAPGPGDGGISLALRSRGSVPDVVHGIAMSGLVLAGAQMGSGQARPSVPPPAASKGQALEGHGLPVGMERRPCFPGLIFR